MNNVNKIIRSIRSNLDALNLDKNNVDKNPMIQFEHWMENALEAKVPEPNAMTLATVNKKGQPDTRIVLLRGMDKNGFSFFTNYKSAKGKEINENKKVCLNFYWAELARQVRVKGVVEKLSSKISDEYFHSRPYESQLGAWASDQSEEIESREMLEKKYKELALKFSKGKIKRPPHWGGFIVKPFSIEFWQGRANRLHDRVLYEKNKSGKWNISRLAP